MTGSEGGNIGNLGFFQIPGKSKISNDYEARKNF